MEGDSEKSKISYFHHWIDGERMGKIKSWKNKKILISQEKYDKLEENEKEGKYSSEKIESYFTLCSSPQVKSIIGCRRALLCQARFYGLRRISCTCSENCQKMQISLHQGRKRAIRDTIFLGMNSTWARDNAINLINEEGKELTVEFLMQQLEIEDCNAQHKSLSQLDSTTSVNFAAYDHRQNRGKSNKSK